MRQTSHMSQKVNDLSINTEARVMKIYLMVFLLRSFIWKLELHDKMYDTEKFK